jgi:peptidoglycan/LPS O-acetylase OafA/YrhL
MLGRVHLGGMTLSRAEQTIAKALDDGNFIKDPQVSILPLQIRTRPFYPGGSFVGYFCFGAACYFLQHVGSAARGCTPCSDSAWVPTGAVVFLGGLTYPLYLLHENIGYALLNTLFSAETRWSGLAYVAALSFVVAAAVYLWFELPVRRRLRSAVGHFTTTSWRSAR